MTEQRICLANGVVIEPATIEDVSQIVALHASLYIPTYRGVTPELTEEVLKEHIEDPATGQRIGNSHRRLINSPKEGIVLVARSGDTVVGYGAAHIDEKGKHWNGGLYVSQQGEGIGRALTRARVLWHGSVDIFLNVAPKTAAVDFHYKMGFRLTGVRTYTEQRGGQELPLDEMKLSVSNQYRALS